MSFGVIYKITNLQSGKCYVGQTTQRPSKRWTQHKANRSRVWPIQRAIAKYGAAQFTFEVLERCMDRAALDAGERVWIASLNCMHPNGYNLTEGGGGTKGYRFSKEWCIALGNRMRGRISSPETRLKISASNKGRKLSEEARARVALGHVGLKRSPETRAKIAAASSRHKHSPETIERIRMLSASRRHTEQAKAKLCRPVIAAGTEYGSLSAAAAAIGVSITTVQRRIEKGMVGYSMIIAMKRRRKRTAEQVERHRQKISKPVVVDGRNFPSVQSAADALSMKRQALIYRLKRGFPGFAYREAA